MHKILEGTFKALQENQELVRDFEKLSQKLQKLGHVLMS